MTVSFGAVAEKVTLLLKEKNKFRAKKFFLGKISILYLIETK
jgi:hypothetical protein